MTAAFNNAFSEHLWDARYCASATEKTIEHTWRRVADTLAARESDAARWRREFYEAMVGFRFLPGGRILAGAGIDDHATLVNCFVAAPPKPSAAEELAHLVDVCRTLEFGGGVGCDFSGLERASGKPGLTEYLALWDAAAGLAESSRFRRGALMGTCRCDHPDIDRFVAAKDQPNALPHFNLSVLLSDAFMAAVRAGTEYPLRSKPGGEVVAQVDAQELFARIARSACARGEPGVLFVDTINRENNLWYYEQITATNPCGEVPLPPHGACVLGSVNLAALVRQPFLDQASFDFAQLEHLASVGVRMLDNVIDATTYPLSQQRDYALGCRRVGLGITGLGDAVAMLGWDYGDADSISFVHRVMQTLSTIAYETSLDLAREKGPFAKLDRECYLQSGFAQRLPDGVRRRIAEHGIRNSHLVAIAPAGSISLLANNVSSGIEPIFALDQERVVTDAVGARRVRLQDYAMACVPSAAREAVIDETITAREVAPEQHLALLAAAQPFVDNAIAKTINLPQGCQASEVEAVFQQAFELGLKGCTVFPLGGERGSVLQEVCSGDPR